MNKEQRKQFLKDNWRITTLNFKWSKSGVCRIYDRRTEKTPFHAGGYGYDKSGTCLGNLIEHYFNNEIKKLNSDDFYGLRHWNTKTRKSQKRSSKHTRTSLSGASGFNSMQRILEKIGFKLDFVLESNNQLVYTLKTK
tara:strand:+ start:560 stop:973 length:414 start_codon:yes stop_codon:yes gene_type:complete